MPNIAYAEGAVNRAREDGLHLVILHIDGKPAKRDGMTMAGPVGPKTAQRLRELFVDLCDVKKRME